MARRAERKDDSWLFTIRTAFGILETDSFSGYEQNFKQRKHFEKANPRY